MRSLKGEIQGEIEAISTLSSVERIVKLWIDGKTEESLAEVAGLLNKQKIRQIIKDTIGECTDWIRGRIRTSEAVYKPKLAVKKILAVRSKYPILSLVRRLVRAICQEKGCEFFDERAVTFIATRIVHLSVDKTATTISARVVNPEEIKRLLHEGRNRWGFRDDSMGGAFTDFAFKVALFTSILCYYIVERDPSVWELITREAMKNTIGMLKLELSKEDVNEILSLLNLT